MTTTLQDHEGLSDVEVTSTHGLNWMSPDPIFFSPGNQIAVNKGLSLPFPSLDDSTSQV